MSKSYTRVGGSGVYEDEAMSTNTMFINETRFGLYMEGHMAPVGI